MRMPKPTPILVLVFLSWSIIVKNEANRDNGTWLRRPFAGFSRTIANDQ
jgi:hypothetical protein